MAEFELAGQTYKLAKLSAMQQLHVSRRLAPIVPKLLPALASIAQDAQDLTVIASAVAPAADALAAMSDADTEYIYSACLSVVSRKQGAMWSSVWSGKSPMFDDIDLGVMTQLVVKVVADSLSPFIRGILDKVRESIPATAA